MGHEDLARQLADLGLSASVDSKGDGTTLRISRGATSAAFALVSRPGVRLSSLNSPRASDAVPEAGRFVYTDHVGAKTGDAFRRADIRYLDYDGNAWIEFGDVLIDVRGRRAGAPAVTPSGGGELFTTGRSQVIFALLAWPNLWRAPRRDLAASAGVSLGQAHKTLVLLREAGYGDEAGRSPFRTELLDLWSAAFPTGLSRRLALATFSGAATAVKPVEDLTIAVSGEAAVPNALRPASLIVYVDRLDPRMAIANRWRTDAEPNVTVRRKFWTTPTTEQPVENAPWPLVYADLMASDDPRLMRVARNVKASRESPR